MTIVAGFDPDAHGRAVLHLATMLARSADDELVMCAVIPQSWPLGPARVDAEYRAQVERIAGDSLVAARERIGDDVPEIGRAHV